MLFSTHDIWLVGALRARCFVHRDGQFDREMLGLMAFGTGSILGPLVGKDDQGGPDLNAQGIFAGADEGFDF